MVDPASDCLYSAWQNLGLDKRIYSCFYMFLNHSVVIQQPGGLKFLTSKIQVTEEVNLCRASLGTGGNLWRISEDRTSCLFTSVHSLSSMSLIFAIALWQLVNLNVHLELYWRLRIYELQGHRKMPLNAKYILLFRLVTAS